jgi:hypothetical protein
MSAVDMTVGYPVHAVATYAEWTNKHRVTFTDWKATCGATGTATGGSGTAFGRSGSARKAELCRTCWPAGHATYHPAPVWVAR